MPYWALDEPIGWRMSASQCLKQFKSPGRAYISTKAACRFRRLSPVSGLFQANLPRGEADHAPMRRPETEN